MRRLSAAVVLVVLLIASAARAQVGGGSAAVAQPGAPASDTTGVIAVAPPGTVWISLPAAQFRDSASAMVGRYVETYGTVSSLLILSRTSRFNNTGWLRDADLHELATLLFDQLSDYYLDWMRRNKCNNPACNFAYVRGQVVLDHRNAVLLSPSVRWVVRLGAKAGYHERHHQSVASATDGSARVQHDEVPVLPEGSDGPCRSGHDAEERPDESVQGRRHRPAEIECRD